VNGLLTGPGETAVLVCEPTIHGTEIQWFKDEEKLDTEDNRKYSVVVANSSLEIHYAGRKDIGEYVCKENDESEATVMLFAAPYVRNDSSINLNKGNTLEVECLAWGHPKPTVTWYSKGRAIVADGVRVTFSNTSEALGGMLHMEDMQLEDYDHYVCSAYNEYGVHNGTTLVRVKSPLAALWPILGIVIQLGILAVIIFFYERKKKSTLAAAEKKE
jgi:hypothetical protein